MAVEFYEEGQNNSSLGRTFNARPDYSRENKGNFLIRAGIVRTSNTANILLVGIALSLFTLTVFIFYKMYGSGTEAKDNLIERSQRIDQLYEKK